jgi:hypothetical protein
MIMFTTSTWSVVDWIVFNMCYVYKPVNMMHPIVHHSLRVAQVRGLSFTHIMFDLPIYFSEQLLSFMYVVDIHFAFPLLSERSI